MSKAQVLIILEVYKSGQVRKYEIEKAEFVIGRGGNSEVPLDEPGISREHIKLFYKNNHLQILDLNSSNGTSVNQIKLASNVPREIQPFDVIRLGNTAITLKAKLFEFNYEAKHELATIIPQATKVEAAPAPAPASVPNPASATPSVAQPAASVVSTSAAAPKMPSQKRPSPPQSSLSRDIAKDAIREAEEAKLSILKNAEAQKLKIIEEAKRLAKQEVHSAFEEHEKSMEFLLEETRKEVAKLKDEAERMMVEKRQQAQDEIDQSWKEHEESISEAKANYQEKIDRDNKHKLEILKEKLQAEAYAERNKIITVAESEILSRKRAYQNEHEADKKQYVDKVNELNTEISNKRSELNRLSEDIQNQVTNKLDLETNYQKMLGTMDAEKKQFEQHKTEQLDQLNYERLKVLESIQAVKDELVHEKTRVEKELKAYELDINEQKDKIKLSVQDSIKELDEQHKRLDLLHREIEMELTRKKQVEDEISALRKEISNLNPLKVTALNELQDINQKVTAFNEKKNELQDQVTTLQKAFFEEKNKIKHDLDLEYQTLKHTEQAKFDDFKAKQLKELQKVREDHTNSIQMLSQNLAKEIAHTLELQAAKNDGRFDYDNSLELINSIIHVKSSGLTGGTTTTAQAVQIDNYRVKRRGERYKTLFAGAALGIALLYLGNYAYERITTDPRIAEMAKLKDERQKREIANKYTAEKTDQYYDNYVDLTLFTKDYTQAYLNDDNQSEWVQFATKYFLRNWKVEEEKTIKVISATRALVQNISETEDQLKKNTLKQDIEKLRTLEKESAQSNSKVLGSFVRLEAYKKHEKEFFMKKMGYRMPAGK